MRETTFKRPGLDAMVDEIRAGNVATVIVKDQSRIGRDVVEVGLLKRTFDKYIVRFIAANDNLDTANRFDIISKLGLLTKFPQARPKYDIMKEQGARGCS